MKSPVPADLKQVGQEMQSLIHELRLARAKLPDGDVRQRVERSLHNAAHVFSTARAMVQMGEQVDDFLRHRLGVSAMQLLDMTGLLPDKRDVKKMSPAIAQVLQSVNRDLRCSLVEAQLLICKEV